MYLPQNDTIGFDPQPRDQMKLAEPGSALQNPSDLAPSEVGSKGGATRSRSPPIELTPPPTPRPKAFQTAKRGQRCPKLGALIWSVPSVPSDPPHKV